MSLDGPRGRTCQNIVDSPAPLSGDFPEVTASTRGSCGRRGGEEGLVRVNVSVAGPGSGRSRGQADRSSVNRSISQADPQGIFLVSPREQVPLCASFSSRSPFIGPFFTEGKKVRILAAAKKSVGFLLNFDRISLFRTLSIRTSKIHGEKGATEKKTHPARNDLSIASLLVAHNFRNSSEP